MSCFSKIFEKNGEFMKLANAAGAAGAKGVSDAVKPPLRHSFMQVKGQKAPVIMPG